MFNKILIYIRTGADILLIPRIFPCHARVKPLNKVYVFQQVTVQMTS